MESVNLVIPYVEKLSMRLYNLREVTINGKEVVQDVVLATDLPFIIYGKLTRRLRDQEVRSEL